MAEKNEEKKYFKLDHKKKFVTVDTTITPEKGDKEAVALYVEMGYKMRIKSQKRAAEMKSKADKTDAADIRKALEGNDKALKKFNNIIIREDTNDEGKTGFFAAKKWYVDNFTEKKKKD